MMRAGDFLIKQSSALLENKRHATIVAALLSILPFISWLSVSVVALVTLRKGNKQGFEVMLPALVIHSVPLMMLVPWDSAFINTFIAYVPCYFAAMTLRKSSSWQLVFGMFLLQALLGYLLIQWFAPDFLGAQFNQFKELFSDYQSYNELFESNNDGLSLKVWSQLFFGFQMLGAIASCSISLMFARSVQSKLFMPGGFAKEMRTFRCGRVSFLVFIACSIAAYYLWPIGMCLLPAVVAYFLVSGFNLAYVILAKKQQMKIMILLLLLILVKPAFVIFAYIIFGVLDSIFNFRLYLPTVVRDSI